MQLAFQQVSSLIPFAPILKNGDNQETIQQALRVMRADEKLNELETVLGFFATFVLDSAIVQSIMGWDMAILQESPWYQQICKESEEIGEQRGKADVYKRQGCKLSSGACSGKRDELELLSIVMPYILAPIDSLNDISPIVSATRRLSARTIAHFLLFKICYFQGKFNFFVLSYLISLYFLHYSLAFFYIMFMIFILFDG